MSQDKTVLYRDSVVDHEIEERHFKRTSSSFISVIFIIHLNSSFCILNYAVINQAKRILVYLWINCPQTIETNKEWPNCHLSLCKSRCLTRNYVDELATPLKSTHRIRFNLLFRHSFLWKSDGKSYQLQNSPWLGNKYQHGTNLQVFKKIWKWIAGEEAAVRWKEVHQNPK